MSNMFRKYAITIYRKLVTTTYMESINIFSHNSLDKHKKIYKYSLVIHTTNYKILSFNIVYFQKNIGDNVNNISDTLER